MKCKGIISAVLFLVGLLVHAQATIKVQSVDETNGLGIPFAEVKLIKSGLEVVSGQMNAQGYFEMKNMEAGTYELQVSHDKYVTYYTKGIVLGNNKTAYVDAKLALKSDGKKKKRKRK